ncbi:hypothetical protein AVEN_19671-1 [Araneus ventricosus]|uniref:Uncharacterized protein n=1 Tax=Araneus ventricosus TaxID=182803 RepID=A0A4Y2C5M8_ARAVE|nr:hypothetical protein AVEN_19671-1 [Araneus ventricosus]
MLTNSLNLFAVVIYLHDYCGTQMTMITEKTVEDQQQKASTLTQIFHLAENDILLERTKQTSSPIDREFSSVLYRVPHINVTGSSKQDGGEREKTKIKNGSFTPQPCHFSQLLSPSKAFQQDRGRY